LLSPVSSDPPWIHTMTGRLRSLASAGAKTFRYRQSSDVLPALGGEAGCAQRGAKRVA
jgi:hypothetical protein